MKLLVLAVLAFFGYRLFFNKPELRQAEKREQIKSESDDESFTDYEEVE